jgi:hypothetical protein
MTRAPSNGFDGPETRMESFWLPPDAEGNGLPASRWAEIIVVSRPHAEQLLAAFAAGGVPARMAHARGPAQGEQDTRIWIDPSRYAAAENVLLREMSRRG